jgi:dimethylargininase
MLTRAIVRRPGPDCGRGLTTAGLGPPDFERLSAQHRAYIGALRALGLTVTILPVEPGFPDAYFVEDTAVVTPRLAVITNPGAPSRRGEVTSIAPALARHRPLCRVKAPATVDGGDVLMVENHFFIGVSRRTNLAGARALGRHLQEHGHTWTPVPVASGLHLKSSVSYLGQGRLLMTRDYAERQEFEDFPRVILDPGDEYAANTLWVNGSLLIPAGFPKARKKLERLVLPLVELEVSEIRKMDGGLTCLSLRF